MNYFKSFKRIADLIILILKTRICIPVTTKNKCPTMISYPNSKLMGHPPYMGLFQETKRGFILER
jgi:hypothetical protein